ncbi:MAG: FmdB family zinc ribbon protein [Candidatus Omnitrophota bacterium]|nr:zinc ribbon domain-containing protein [Candidatus Omnitrophota bacterium]
MPTYNYECSKCGAASEVFQKITDKHLSKCPQCKGKVDRLIGSGSGLIFKGTGFYSTDYKKSSVPAAPTKAEHNTCCDKKCPKNNG